MGSIGIVGPALVIRRAAEAPSLDRAKLERQAQGEIDKARTMFTKLGLGARDGNGPVKVEIEPIHHPDGDGHFHNAAYNMLEDKIMIGHVPSGASYAASTDVLAHEYTHRIIDHVKPLLPIGQSGAVGESLADTFAAVVDRDDWVIGEDVHPGGIRSMENPSRREDAEPMILKDPRTGRTREKLMPMPSHMDDYMRTSADGGGVHLNAGIPNKAAHLIGEALGRDAMAKVYMNAVVNHLQTDSVTVPKLGTRGWTSIAGLAQATIDSAKELGDTRAVTAVRDAWEAVGLTEPKIRQGLVQQSSDAERIREMIAKAAARGHVHGDSATHQH